MKKSKTVPMYSESNMGHDTVDVPNNPNDVKDAVETQLKDGRWVTTEKIDGSKETMTAADLPLDNTPSLAGMKVDDGWKQNLVNDTGKPAITSTSTKSSKPNVKRFEHVTSITSTKPAKGG